MPDALEDTSPEPQSHPEEIGATFDMRVGRHVTLQGRARITPAGVLASGVAVALMTVALGYLVGSLARRRR